MSKQAERHQHVHFQVMHVIRFAILAAATIVAAASCARDNDRVPKPVIAVERISNIMPLGGVASASNIDNPVGVLPLPEGRFAAIDGATFSLEVFGSDGRVLFRDGGKGDGPGEFRAVSTFFPVGSDSIAVWDSQLKRVSIFSKTLNLLVSKTVDRWPTNGRLRIIGRLSSGEFIGLSAKAQSVAGSAGRFIRDITTIVVGHLDSLPRPIASLAGARSLKENINKTTTYLALPDDNPRAIAVCGDSVVAFGASSVSYYAASGNARAQSSETHDFNVPSTAADAPGRTSMLTSLVADAPAGDERSRILGELNTAVPETLKLPHRPIIAASDEVWFLSGRDPLSLEQRDSQGGVTQRIAWSARDLPLRIEPGRVIAMMIDSLGEQTLRVLTRARGIESQIKIKSNRCGPTFVY